MRQVHQRSVLFVIYHFLNMRFKFQSTVCNGCNNVLMMSLNNNHIAILDTNGIDYRYIIVGTGKSEDINLLKNSDMSENSGSLYNIKNSLHTIQKMNKDIIPFGDIESKKRKFHYARYSVNINICRQLLKLKGLLADMF